MPFGKKKKSQRLARKAQNKKIQRKWIWIVSCDFGDLVFCQTARSKENKKTSRHTIRPEIHKNIFWRSLARGAEVRFGETRTCVWNAKRHKVKKIKRMSRHKIRKYKENGFGSSPAILRFVFCQTARSKENKKISRHTIRKYIEYISRSHARGAEVRCGGDSFGMPNGTK